MFNLIMRRFEWASGTGDMPRERFFEYTDEEIAAQFRDGNNLRLDRLAQLPCLLMEEGTQDEIARVGRIDRPRLVGANVVFNFVLDRDVPPLQNSFIHSNQVAFEMPRDFEFSRNHWAVKDVDLYRLLWQRLRSGVRQRPAVFALPEHEVIDSQQTSAMMPFAASFNAVYAGIESAAHAAGLRCNRADSIWEHHTIIQDVVSLIDRSRIVVVDCTDRNPNVFYETGIAHTLGREVILITQSSDDVPFDLRHLRYIRYHNNGEGIARLQEELSARMRAIVGARPEN
jgi:hypothetical protein